MGTLLDLPIATQALDSSGEILDIKNLDISDFEEGKAFANFEHNNDNPADIVGIFRYAKKILKEEDCETSRQKEYWKKLKHPFVYGICELFDSEDHPGAIAVAAMVRFFAKKNEPIQVGASIEGATLEREDNYLKRAVGRKCAITLRPCNKECWVDLVDDGTLKDTIKKFEDNQYPMELIKVEASSLEMSDVPVNRSKSISEIYSDLTKTLTAGSYDTAPSNLTQGAALQTEGLRPKRNAKTIKNILRAAVRDWDRVRPLRDVVKAALPEVSDDYVDRFTDLAEEISLKKGLPSLKRITDANSVSMIPDETQSELINGLYLDPQSFESDLQNPVTLRNDTGKEVKVRLGEGVNHSSSDYYNLARNFFGLGDHVPVTNSFTHELSSNVAQAIQHLPEALSSFSANFDGVLQQAREDGSLHKLALMDMITGHDDRHYGNVMANGGRIVHVDNDGAFAYNAGSSDYSGSIGEDTLHMDANQWLLSLDPKELFQQMGVLGIDKSKMLEAGKRLKMLQLSSSSGSTFNNLYDTINNVDSGEAE